jgi:hypothetical protein
MNTVHAFHNMFWMRLNIDLPYTFSCSKYSLSSRFFFSSFSCACHWFLPPLLWFGRPNKITWRLRFDAARYAVFPSILLLYSRHIQTLTPPSTRYAVFSSLPVRATRSVTLTTYARTTSLPFSCKLPHKADTTPALTQIASPVHTYSLDCLFLQQRCCLNHAGRERRCCYVLPCALGWRVSERNRVMLTDVHCWWFCGLWGIYCLLGTKTYPFYLKTQPVPRSKHFSPRL